MEGGGGGGLVAVAGAGDTVGEEDFGGGDTVAINLVTKSN